MKNCQEGKTTASPNAYIMIMKNHVQPAIPINQSEKHGGLKDHERVGMRA